MQVGEPCGALLEAVFGVVDDALALFGRDGSLVCASASFLGAVGNPWPALTDLVADDRMADLRPSSFGLQTSLRLRAGLDDWEGRAKPVAVAGKHGLLVALSRRTSEELPTLESSPPSAEDSWHRVSRRSLETMALGRALEDLPVGMALIESTASGGFEVIARNGAYSTMLPSSEAPEGTGSPRGEAFASDQTTSLASDEWPKAGKSLHRAIPELGQ